MLILMVCHTSACAVAGPQQAAQPEGRNAYESWRCHSKLSVTSGPDIRSKVEKDRSATRDLVLSSGPTFLPSRRSSRTADPAWPSQNEALCSRQVWKQSLSQQGRTILKRLATKSFCCTACACLSAWQQVLLTEKRFCLRFQAAS